MQYEQLTKELYRQLVSKGYLFLYTVFLPMDPVEVGFPEGSPYAHREIIPGAEQPADFDMDKGAYYDIGSPEAVDLFEDHYDTYFWVHKKHLK